MKDRYQNALNWMEKCITLLDKIAQQRGDTLNKDDEIFETIRFALLVAERLEGYALSEEKRYCTGIYEMMKRDLLNIGYKSTVSKYTSKDSEIVKELESYYIPKLKHSMDNHRKFAYNDENNGSLHHGAANAFEVAIGCIEEAISKHRKIK